MNERQRALDLALTQIEKQFGKGSIMKLGEASTKLAVEVIPTGALGLDLALGVGGVPRGRVIEVYGPESSGKTTLGYHIIAEAQREAGVAAFIDAEHALDPNYAKSVGVDVDSMLISQPDSGEQALEIAEMLVRSGAVDVIVVDSVAALVPKAELEGEMGEAHMGLQARLMSQALRKLVGASSRSRTTVVFINHLREKIGVMFGCFDYNARVVLADGSTEKIGKIVNQRMPVEVLSYDLATGSIQPRRVVHWFDNGVAEYFLQFEVEGGGSGRRRFAATPSHMIFTPRGEVPAGKLRVGDEVLVGIEDYRVTEDQLQLRLGSALGDGSFGGHFDRWGEGKAVLYNKSLQGDSRERVAGLFERLGVGRPRDDDRGFWFSSEQTRRLHELIAPYLHPSVGYKLHPKLRGHFDWQPDLSDAHLNGTRLAARRHWRTARARITKIYVKPPTRSMHRFDLEIEGNHTYLVDGIIVHNSPETTTGGRALKFYASVRIEIRRTESIKVGEEIKGMRARVKVVKNKLAPPFRDAEVDIYFGHGISKAASTLDVAALHGIVQRTGTWFSFGELKLGQGRDNARDFLDANPEVTREIERRVRTQLRLVKPSPPAPAEARDGPPAREPAKGRA